jgi:hypothetical protein
MTVVELGDDGVVLRLSSTLRVRYEGQWSPPERGMTDVLSLPEAPSWLLGVLLREGELAPAATAQMAGLEIDGALAALRVLEARGLAVQTTQAGEQR